MTENQLSNALAVVLLLITLVHTICFSVMPFLKFWNYKHGRRVRM